MKLEMPVSIGDLTVVKVLEENQGLMQSNAKTSLTPIGFKSNSLVCDADGCWYNGQRYSTGARVNMGTQNSPNWCTCQSDGSWF